MSSEKGPKTVKTKTETKKTIKVKQRCQQFSRMPRLAAVGPVIQTPGKEREWATGANPLSILPAWGWGALESPSVAVMRFQGGRWTLDPGYHRGNPSGTR